MRDSIKNVETYLFKKIHKKFIHKLNKFKYIKYELND